MFQFSRFGGFTFHCGFFFLTLRCKNNGRQEIRAIKFVWQLIQVFPQGGKKSNGCTAAKLNEFLPPLSLPNPMWAQSLQGGSGILSKESHL